MHATIFGVGKKAENVLNFYHRTATRWQQQQEERGVSGEGGLCVKFGHGVLSSSKRTIITNDPIRKKFPFATFSEKLEKYQL